MWRDCEEGPCQNLKSESTTFQIMKLSDIFMVWSARIHVKFEFICTTQHLGDWDGLTQPWNIIVLHYMEIMIVKLQLCYVMSTNVHMNIEVYMAEVLESV